MRHRSLWFLAVSLAILTTARPAAAQRSWDDAGGSASKLWSDFGNWNPDGSPASEAITIGDLAAAANDTTIVDMDFAIDSLTMSNGADVDTSGNELRVNGLTTLGGTGTSIVVRPRSAGDMDGLDAEGIVVNSGASVSLLGETGLTAGGIVELESGLFEINSGGAAGGHGTIQLINSGTVGKALENSGRLYVAGRPGLIIGTFLPGNMTITNDGSGTGTVDLDGDSEDGFVDVDDDSGGSILTANSLTLNIEVPLADAFGGQMDIGINDTVNIDSGWSIGAGTLNLLGAGTHTVAGGTLTVGGSTSVVNASAGTSVFQNNLIVNAGTFMIATDATVQFDGGATFNDASTIDNGSHTQIIVNSTVNIGGASVTAGEDFDWDGSGFLDNETIVNSTGNLNINVENLDAAGNDFYNGTITMNSGDIDVQVGDGAWEMAGQLNLNNSASNMPILSGDSMTLTGDVDAGGSGRSVISATVTMSGTPTINVAAGAELQFSGASLQTNNSTIFSGDGVIQLDSTTTTVDTLTVSMPGGTVDLDGVDITGFDRILISGQFTLNVAAVDSGSSNVFNNDEIEIGTAGQLAINFTNASDSWVMDGILDLNGTTAFLSSTTHLNGADVELRGATDVTGTSRTAARVDITGIVDIGSASSTFRLGGGNASTNPNTIDGGTVNGPGVLSANEGTALFGNGVINADVDFRELLGGRADLVARDGLLDFNGTLLGVGRLGTEGAAAVLDMANSWNTNVTLTVRLEGGRIQGATIVNDGAGGIDGFGEVIAFINNNTVLAAEGGTLIYNNAANDWDGSANTGKIVADNGDIELRDNAVVVFNGTVIAEAGRTVFANGFGLQFEPASDLELNGGTYRATHATDIGGTVTVGAGTATLRIDGATVFENGSITELTGNLRLDNPNTQIEAGATFTLGGALINVASRTLTILDGANVNVLLQNEGTLVLGGSAGQTQGFDFEQTASGVWVLEIGGTNPVSDFDRMTLTGVAQLDGTLSLSLISGFEATIALGDTFSILSATGGVSGTFTSLIQPPTMPTGLKFDVDYSNPSIVQLEVINAECPDLNMDGFVDIFDVNLVSANWGGPGPAGDANKDGTVDIFDVNVISANWDPPPPPPSQSALIGGAAVVPEPSSVGLLLIGLGLPVLVRRRTTPASQRLVRWTCCSVART